MKTKALLVGIIALVLSVLLPSCGALEDPDMWAVEIEDSYRMQLSLMYTHGLDDADLVDDFIERLDNKAHLVYNKKVKRGYKMALEQMAMEEKIAEDILKIYDTWEVRFSKWTKQPDEGDFSVWQAIEENTGIKVIFKNNSALDWHLDVDPETLIQYLINVDIKTEDNASTPKTKVDVNIDDNTAIELICSRICDQYNGRYTDDKIMSKAFYSIFHKAQLADDSEVGWPDWDYWECTQGAYAKLSSVDVDVISETKATAHILLFYPENGEYTEVEMPMVYENNNWYVDDIISYEKDDNKYSLREVAKMISNR